MINIHRSVVWYQLPTSWKEAWEFRAGGAIKKLKKVCAKDEKILELLVIMEEIRLQESDEEEVWHKEENN